MTNRLFNQIFPLFCVFLILAISSGCHSSRNSSTSGKDAQLYSAASAYNREWQNVQMPLKVALNAPTRFSLSGRATMVRDSEINISMRILGMEVAAVNINQDSIFVIDRYHKYMFAESTSTVLGNHQMSVGQIQDLLLGVSATGNNPMVFPRPDGNGEVTVAFSDFVTTPAGQIASTVNIGATVSGKIVDASLYWSTGKAEWNQSGLTFNFTPPARGYTRLGANDVIELLRNFSF